MWYLRSLVSIGCGNGKFLLPTVFHMSDPNLPIVQRDPIGHLSMNVGEHSRLPVPVSEILKHVRLSNLDMAGLGPLVK